MNTNSESIQTETTDIYDIAAGKIFNLPEKATSSILITCLGDSRSIWDACSACSTRASVMVLEEVNANRHGSTHTQNSIQYIHHVQSNKFQLALDRRLWKVS